MAASRIGGEVMADDQATLRRYLVTILLDPPTTERLAKVGAAVQKILRGASTAPPEVAFTAKDRSVVSYLVRTSVTARDLHSRIASPGGRFDSRTPPILLGTDAVLVLEIGASFCISADRGRVYTWLQRN